MEKTKVLLSKILDDLFKMADFVPYKEHKIKLDGGLEIRIKKVIENYHLIITREKVQPSLMEWKIVLEKAGLKMKPPTTYKKENQFYLMGIFER